MHRTKPSVKIKYVLMDIGNFSVERCFQKYEKLNVKNIDTGYDNPIRIA
jgi:hypothetical protein